MLKHLVEVFAVVEAAVGKALHDVDSYNMYWTSTDVDPGYGTTVYSVFLEEEGARFADVELEHVSYVRACLSF